MSKPISTRHPSVVVEYDCRGERKQKRFDDLIKARRLWLHKERTGKNPKVKKET